MLLLRVVVLAVAGTICGGAAGQLAEPNQAGVRMGHLHYFVNDIEASRDFWLRLGGTRVAGRGDAEVVRMPGVLVFLTEAERESGGSVLDHVAFRVRSLDEMASRGFEIELIEAFPGIASVYTPDGDRVELFEEGTATNIGFDPEDASLAAGVAGRHNRPLAGPFDSHHLHYYLPEADVPAARDWYVRHFGAVAGVRWRYQAADLPGMNFNFSATDPARAPTASKTLAHIGFEVRNLEQLVANLELAGLDFDQGYRMDSGLATAILTDPWGTTIELTEGLDGF